MLTIAAVIATHDRPELLAKRALAAVAKQTRLPDYLIVVDDSNPDFRGGNAQIVSGLSVGVTRKIYLENRRTPGASGAWNTALNHLHELDTLAYVAILDDDDSWDQAYLERCEQTVLENRLDMVAAGLAFHRSLDSEPELLDPPDHLVTGDLLVRNTHIQGSNLFVCVRKLLEAGGFDEALASTTDRDICIRLGDLGSVRYAPLKEHLVHHFADSDRARLSTPGSEAKRTGLRYFFRKYRGRMSEEQQTAFIERSRSLFDCDPTEPVPTVYFEPSASNSHDSGSSLTLVVGAITSPDT